MARAAGNKTPCRRASAITGNVLGRGEKRRCSVMHQSKQGEATGETAISNKALIYRNIYIRDTVK